MSSKKEKKKTFPPDFRKQLFNEGKMGPIKNIQVSTERIVQVRGILFDLDPPIYRRSPLIKCLKNDPRDFYKSTAKAWLSHHPLLDKAEVRCSGTGLHAISWLKDPVAIESADDRERWSVIIQVVQAALPVDPQAPGITATTRVIGSTNGKNGARVVRLRRGQPVEVDDVLGLYETMLSAPFKTVMTILTGTDRISPCPFCSKPESTLSALDFVGNCYTCGRVTLNQLYDLVFRPHKPTPKKAK